MVKLNIYTSSDEIIKIVPEKKESSFKSNSFHNINFNKFIIKVGKDVKVNFNVNTFFLVQLFIETIEEKMNICPSTRAKEIRIILNELNRVLDHFNVIGNCLSVCDFNIDDFKNVEIETSKVIKKYLDFAKVHTVDQLLSVGGLVSDIKYDYLTDLSDLMDFLCKHIEISLEKKLQNKFWLLRARNVGVVSSSLVTEYSITGPTARASNVRSDIRKEIRNIVVAEKGDIESRILVRASEVKQSINIIKSIINNISNEEVKNYNPQVYFDSKRNLINHYAANMNGISLDEGAIFGFIETSNGISSMMIECNGSDRFSKVELFLPEQNVVELLKNEDLHMAIDDFDLCANSFGITYSKEYFYGD